MFRPGLLSRQDAEELNALMRDVRNLRGGIRGNNRGTVNMSLGGVDIRFHPTAAFLARITGSGTLPAGTPGSYAPSTVSYTWNALDTFAQGSYSDRPSGNAGTSGSQALQPAYEINGNATVPNGTIVLMFKGWIGTDTTVQNYLFSTGATPSGTPETYVARTTTSVTALSGTTAGNGTVQIYQLNPGTGALTATADPPFTAWNDFPFTVANNTFVVLIKEQTSGKFFIINELAAASTLTVAEQDDHSSTFPFSVPNVTQLSFQSTDPANVFTGLSVSGATPNAEVILSFANLTGSGSVSGGSEGPGQQFQGMKVFVGSSSSSPGAKMGLDGTANPTFASDSIAFAKGDYNYKGVHPGNPTIFAAFADPNIVIPGSGYTGSNIVFSRDGLGSSGTSMVFGTVGLLIGCTDDVGQSVNSVPTIAISRPNRLGFGSVGAWGTGDAGDSFGGGLWNHGWQKTLGFGGWVNFNGHSFGGLPIPIATEALVTPSEGVSVPKWVKVTKTFTDFATAGVNNTIPIYTLPAGGVILACKAKHSIQFTGGTLTNYQLTLVQGVATYFTGTFEMDSVPTATNGKFIVGVGTTIQTIESQTATTTINASVHSIGANLNAATQGSVDIWLLVSVAL